MKRAFEEKDKASARLSGLGTCSLMTIAVAAGRDARVEPACKAGASISFCRMIGSSEHQLLPLSSQKKSMPWKQPFKNRFNQYLITLHTDRT